MTHNEMASAIRTRVADGLSGNLNNQAFSIEQLLEEIDLQRADFAHKYAMTNKLDYKFLVQEIDILQIECRNMSEDCLISAPHADVPSIKIPKIMPIFGDESIQYLGLVNMQEAFATYYHPEDIRNHKVRIRTSRRPYAWVDTAPDENDMHTIYFFNLGPHNGLKYVKLRAIFEHPTRVNLGPDAADIEYPAPLHMQNSIIDVITDKYIRYFRQLQVPPVPNQQNDPIT